MLKSHTANKEIKGAVEQEIVWFRRKNFVSPKMVAWGGIIHCTYQLDTYFQTTAVFVTAVMRLLYGTTEMSAMELANVCVSQGGGGGGELVSPDDPHSFG